MSVEENRCLKCGRKVNSVPKWEQYYCNHYCCNPCCPDAHISPCHKEKIEALELEMRRHLKEMGILTQQEGGKFVKR